MLLEREKPIGSQLAGGSGNTADEVLEALVQADLRQSGDQAIRRVRCHLQGGVLTLLGQVSCYYHKQLAQVAAQRRLVGAARIQNQLEVIPTEDHRTLSPDWREGGECE